MSSLPPQATTLLNAPTGAPPDPRKDVAISVRGVSKAFRVGPATPKTFKERLMAQTSSKPSFQALENVSFDVYRGETFGVLGHNGSGKSTLLKIVAGIMSPSSGEIEVTGRLSALLELGAGFHPELTGSENIHLNATILGLSPGYVARVFDDIVDFAELEGFIDTPVKHYSSGMRARLGFSVATHLEPDVLLVDEVLAVGDERFRRKCMERVHRFRSIGRTMVLVTHGISLVSQLCQRCAVLSHGELLFVGEAEEAISVYRASLASDGAARNQAKAPADSATAPVMAIGGRFLEDDSEPTVKPRGSLHFVVQLQSFEKVPARVRINIRTEEGLVLINQATAKLLGHPLELEPGSTDLTFDFNEIPLRDGRYFVDVMVESPDGKDVFHRLGEAASFRIASDNRHLGLVDLDIRCKLGGPDVDGGDIDRDNTRNGRRHDD